MFNVTMKHQEVFFLEQCVKPLRFPILAQLASSELYASFGSNELVMRIKHNIELFLWLGFVKKPYLTLGMILFLPKASQWHHSYIIKD